VAMTWDAFPPPLPSTSRRSPALPSPPPLGCATLACVPLSPLLVVHLRPSPPLQAKRLCTLVDGHLCKRTFVLATAICLSNGRLLMCVHFSTEICVCVHLSTGNLRVCVCTFVDGRCLRTIVDGPLLVYNCRRTFACAHFFPTRPGNVYLCETATSLLSFIGCHGNDNTG
jgi:hypothetical protein